MRIIDLKQNSNEWLDWRRNKRMASEASVATGRSPWQKPIQLAKVKRGIETVRMNGAMARGHQYEPEARAYLESRLGIIGDPVVIELGDYGASLDWYATNGDETVIGEIKVPSSPESKLWTDGVIPDYYMDQMQQQLAVTGASVCYFLIYLPETQEGKVFEVYPDAKRWAEIQEAWNTFWETYMSGELPDDERSDQDWFDACERYREAKAHADAATTKLEEAKKELIELAPKGAKGCGINLIYSEREGSISWAKAIKELKLDMAQFESYRGKPTTVFTVKEQ